MVITSTYAILYGELRSTYSMNFLIFLKYITKNYPILIGATFFVLVIGGLIEAGALLVIAPIIDIITHPEVSSGITKKIEEIIITLGLGFNLWILLFIYFAVVLVKSLFDVSAMYLILSMKYRLMKATILETYQAIFGARWYFFVKEKQGKLLNTFTREISGMGDCLTGAGRLFAEILKLAMYIIVLFYISWQVALVGFGFSFLVGIPLLSLGKLTYKFGKKNTSTANDWLSAIQENFSLAKIILGFALQKKSENVVKEKFEKHTKATLASQLFTLSISSIYVPLGVLGIIILFYAGKYFSLALSEIGILVVAYMKIIPIMKNIVSEKNIVDMAFPSYEQIMNMIKDAKKMNQTSGNIAFKNINKSIKIKDISFTYPNNKPVINNLSLQIKKGQMIAIVGESGSGKSTLIDVIMGFNDPTSGDILIDDTPLKKYDINSYREKIGYVPQGGDLFHASITQNIKWANEKATNEQIQHMCKEAYADSFIKSFPEGYETLVGDRGIRLSGGQLQRIALARALIRKPEILILDEATSSLDSKSEKNIQEALNTIARKTTIIVIAHRLSTILKADHIFVINHGRVVEEGNYEDLIKLNGSFKKMIEQQAFISTK